MEQKEAAKHIWISQLLEGKFVQLDDSPSSLVLNNETFHKVRIYGIVVSNSELIIDDGTGSILVRSFDKTFNAEVGSFVIAIGRPRNYQGQCYLLGEIVKKTDMKWLEIIKKQHQLPNKEAIPNAIEIVKSLDKGDGADYAQVLARLGNNGEDLIVHLLAMGELFETRPGRLKVLE